MRLALFSDIHGNLTGLEAVLAYLRKAGPFDRVYALGDLTGGGSGAGEVIDLLLAHDVRMIRGNWEELVWNVQAHAHKAPDPEVIVRTVEWTLANLTEAQGRLMRELPLQETIEVAPGVRLLLCHAAPNDPWSLSCRWDVPVDTLRRIYGGADAAVIAYGHYHSHHVLQLDGKQLVNVASVGLRPDGLCALTILEYGAYWSIRQMQIPFDAAREEARKRERGAP